LDAPKDVASHSRLDLNCAAALRAPVRLSATAGISARHSGSSPLIVERQNQDYFAFREPAGGLFATALK
jgi:hypothetical protein